MSLPAPINWMRSSDYFAEVKFPECIWSLLPHELSDSDYDKLIYYYPDTEQGFEMIWGEFAGKVIKSQILKLGALEVELILNFSSDATEKYGLPDNERVRYGEGYRYSLPAPQQKRDEDGDMYSDMDSYFDFIRQEVRPNILLQLGIPDVSFREIIYRVQCVVRSDDWISNEELGGVQARLERAYLFNSFFAYSGDN